MDNIFITYSSFPKQATEDPFRLTEPVRCSLMLSVLFSRLTSTPLSDGKGVVHVEGAKLTCNART